MKVGTCQGSNLDSNPCTSDPKSSESASHQPDEQIEKIIVKQEFDDVTNMCGTNLPLFEIQGPAFDDE